MNKTIRFITLGLFGVMVMSCVTQKQMTYLHDANDNQDDVVNVEFKAKSETILRNGDALTIFVSALDKEAVAPYNLPTVVFTNPGSTSVQTTPMLQYYIVDENGEVNMPVLGKIRVAGLSRAGAEEAIRQRLEGQVLNPSVQVRLVNAKISVLGEVNRPCQVPMVGDRMTILDALAAAGDMTPYGRRDNVLITREVDGKIEMARVNLRNTDLLNSPYYYLQQNDVIYVSPNKVRAISSANAGLWISLVGTLASTAAVIVTIVK